MKIKMTRESSFIPKQEYNLVIKQKLSQVLLDVLALYVISENRNIRKKGYTNIQELISILDKNQYKEELELETLAFIKLGLEARLKYNLVKKEQVIDYIRCHNDNVNLKIDTSREISNSEVEYINSQVTAILDTAEYEANILVFSGLADEYNRATPFQKKDIAEEWKDQIMYWANKYRLHTVENAEDDIVSLRNGVFEDYAREVHRDMSNPSNKLSTGMVGFNHLLDGGFESGRVYCLYGLQGEGKSTTLLNLAMQIKNYNKRYKPKDRTKTPVVVYLTLENTKKETFNRMFTIATDARDAMTNYSVDECIDMMRNNGLTVDEDSPMDLVIKYKANNSIDTSYLYELSDNLSEMGYEVSAFVIDYLNLIRSVNRFAVSEERLKLGSVVNELKAIAAELDIPIITASQFNRDANAKIDELRANGSKVNTVNALNRSNIGESMLVLNNLDGCYFITPEFINGGEDKYLGVKLAKARYKPNTKALEGNLSIHLPYTRPDGIKLVCDVGLSTPMYKLDLAEAQFNADGVVVDKSVKLPNNNSRCKDDGIIPSLKKKEETKPIINDAGEELMYNPNWRDLPEYKDVPGVGKVLNVDALPPEQQIRIRMKLGKKNVNEKLPERIQIDGPSRYSDEYTDIYDPSGSKEERLAYDYNNMYGKNFNTSHFPYLLDHLNKVKAGILNENNLEISPFVRVENTQRSMFVKVDSVEREVSLRHSPVHHAIQSVAC